MTNSSKETFSFLFGVIAGTMLTLSASFIIASFGSTGPAAPATATAAAPARVPLAAPNLTVYDGCTTCSQAAMRVAWSMDNDPESWTANGYTMARNDARVWIANGAAGLSAGFDIFGNGWKPEDADRKLIWDAAQRWMRWKMARDLGR